MTETPSEMICPNLDQFAAGTVKAFLDEIANMQFEEPLYKVERRQMLAGMVQDDVNCYCEECMAVEAIAAIVGDLSWSPRDRDNMEQLTAARLEHSKAVRKRLGLEPPDEPND